MPRAYVTSRGRAGISFGCLGTVAVGFLYLMGILLLVGVVVAVLALYLLALLVCWAAVAIDRLLVNHNGKWRQRRMDHGPFQPLAKLSALAGRAGNRMPRRR
jgi:hypothetical protein